MSQNNQPITYSRIAAQELVAFLGKLPIESGAALHYAALRSALEAPTAPVAPATASPSKKAPIKAKAATPAKAPADAEKDALRKKRAAENARQWRAKKALEKSAAKAAAATAPAALQEPVDAVQPVLFTN